MQATERIELHTQSPLYSLSHLKPPKTAVSVSYTLLLHVTVTASVGVKCRSVSSHCFVVLTTCDKSVQCRERSTQAFSFLV